MSDKSEAIGQVRGTFKELLLVVRDIPDERFSEIWFGEWSTKDILAHLASYEEVLVDILSTFVGRHSTPYLDKFTGLGGQFNDTEVERRRGRTVKEILDEFNDAHAQAMSLTAQIRPEQFRQVGTLPWYGMDYALDDVIVYMYYGHKREHSAQIAAFRDHLDRLL